MQKKSIFDHATWGTLDGFLRHLPRTVRLVVWGDETRSVEEREAIRLGQKLAERYDVVNSEQRDRLPTYGYYPVLAVMLDGEDGVLDDGVRFIGLPAGYQINSLVGAIQAVSFRASNLEARTRIQLSRLPAEARADLEVFTSADDEEGPLVATLAAGLAVASTQVRAFLIAADVYPEAAIRYSVRTLPHTVIDGRVHLQGVTDEDGMVRQIFRAVQTARPTNESKSEAPSGQGG
jgi:alkyl hydroperoxide reductase subunit AhpF